MPLTGGEDHVAWGAWPLVKRGLGRSARGSKQNSRPLSPFKVCWVGWAGVGGALLAVREQGWPGAVSWVNRHWTNVCRNIWFTVSALKCQIRAGNKYTFSVYQDKNKSNLLSWKFINSRLVLVSNITKATRFRSSKLHRWDSQLWEQSQCHIKIILNL